MNISKLSLRTNPACIFASPGACFIGLSKPVRVPAQPVVHIQDGFVSTDRSAILDQLAKLHVGLTLAGSGDGPLRGSLQSLYQSRFDTEAFETHLGHTADYLTFVPRHTFTEGVRILFEQTPAHAPAISFAENANMRTHYMEVLQETSNPLQALTFLFRNLTKPDGHDLEPLEGVRRDLQRFAALQEATGNDAFTRTCFSRLGDLYTYMATKLERDTYLAEQAWHGAENMQARTDIAHLFEKATQSYKKGGLYSDTTKIALVEPKGLTQKTPQVRS